MAKDYCSHDDNPEITGRGVIISFYLQCFLMVANGLLDIEERDILPSIITLHVIGVTIFYEILIEPSIYLVLILYILLGFHIIASQAVIVWVAEKEHGIRGNDSRSHKELWSTLYHIVQVVGVVGLVVSGYVGLAGRKCDDSIKGFVATQSITTFWFAPVVAVPCLLSMLLTSLLRRWLKESQTTGTRRQDHRSCWRSSLGIIHVLLGSVWIFSLTFMVILLESTLSGNHRQINEPLDTGVGWSFGQILPLVLNVTPVWVFGKHIVDQFNFRDFKDGLWAFLDHILSLFTSTNVSDTEVAPTPEIETRTPEDIILLDRPHRGAAIVPVENVENVSTKSSGFFINVGNTIISGGTFNNIGRGIYDIPKDTRRESTRSNVPLRDEV